MAALPHPEQPRQEAGTSSRWRTRTERRARPGEEGSNNFGIAATPSSPQRLCDARTDTTCPKVYANEYLSVRAAATSSTANFFLSDIGPEHKGKKVVITLWDPAEGGETIRIRQADRHQHLGRTRPSTGSSTNGDPRPGTRTGVTSIDVTRHRLHQRAGHDLASRCPTTYAPPTDNEWWQIAYKFASTGGDRPDHLEREHRGRPRAPRRLNLGRTAHFSRHTE